MPDVIVNILLAQPHRMTLLGRFLYRMAALQVVVGVVAQTVMSAVRRARGGVRWLSDVAPDWPTWWVPETVVGMIVVMIVGAVGLALAYRGRQWERGWV